MKIKHAVVTLAMGLCATSAMAGFTVEDIPDCLAINATSETPGLDGSSPAPFMVVNDGPGYVAAMAPMMDTLIAEKRLPHNLVALFVSSGGSDAQGSQRGLEYDTMDGVFAEFVETEVIPFVSAECGISLTSDPEGRGAMGGSSGGCAAFTMAWYRPDLFRRVLTYSGTYVNQQYPYQMQDSRLSVSELCELDPHTPGDETYDKYNCIMNFRH